MRISPFQHRKQLVREQITESQKFVDVLERIYNKTRGQHNTAALITAAKQHNGLIITHTHKWAKTLQEEHGVNATKYDDPKIWTYEGPVLMDMPTMFDFTTAQHKLCNVAHDLLLYMDNKGVD